MKSLLYIIAIIGILFLGFGGYNIYEKNKIVNEAVIFTIGTGPEEVYLFSDPECPYCKKLSETIDQKFDKYTIHIIPYVSPKHKLSKYKFLWILAKNNDKDRRDRMKKVIEGDMAWKKQISKKDFENSNRSMIKADKVRLELDIKGTPTLLNSDLIKIDPRLLDPTFKNQYKPL